MFININRIGDVITGSMNGKGFSVSFSEERWNAMNEIKARANNAGDMTELRAIMEEFEPLTHESYKEVIESKSPYLYVNPATNRFYLKYNKKVSKHPLPQAFVDRILESVEKNIDPKPLVKAWARFMRNPNYSDDKATKFAWYINQTHMDAKQRDRLLKEGLSFERATALATSYQTPITDEGLIMTYKVSKEITKRFIADPNDGEEVKQVSRYQFEVDEFTGLKTYHEPEHVEDRIFQPAVMGMGGDPFDMYEFSGVLDKADSHQIKVGKIHSLKDWKQVDCNDNRSCVKGLHCGNLDYIRNYQQDDTVTHNVLVDPMHIGAIVQDNTGALRVKEYAVWSSFAGVNRSLYHSATYAALKDEEYAKIVEEVVNRTKDEAIAAAMEEHDEKSSLVGDAAQH